MYNLTKLECMYSKNKFQMHLDVCNEIIMDQFLKYIENVYIHNFKIKTNQT